MRTQDEIVARIREKRSMFSFDAEVLVHSLDFDHAKEFLREERIRPERANEEWNTTYPLSEEAVMKEFADYAQFAWGKAQDHRGLSANRSVDKLEAWTWLLGRDDVLAASEAAPYPSYGCPKLKIICEAFGFPVPTDTETVRMMNGDPCKPDCESGCNS